MPKKVEKSLETHLRTFWDDKKKAPVAIKYLSQTFPQGGMKVLDLTVQNTAIEPMKLQAYLALSPDRSRWVKLADDIYYHNISKKNGVVDRESLKRLYKTAKASGLVIDAPEISNEVKKLRLIWYHPTIMEGFEWNGKWANCLKRRYKVMTVGDLADYVQRDLPHNHSRRRRCQCPICKEMKAKGCETLVECVTNTQALLNLLPPKWDPQCAPSPLTLNEWARTVNEDPETPETGFQPSSLLIDIHDRFQVLVFYL
ncbi:hypothetical protein M422DRAFT_246981 [Sphaerobolus stellatus SS14]|nr:hypothetical protein M422DRAFT_246981 [Sphaerobolus stellatus SS14]